MKTILTTSNPLNSPRRSAFGGMKALLALFLCAFVFASCDRFKDDIDDIEEAIENREVKMFEAYLTPLNESGVTGKATIKYSHNGMFEVWIDAKGLAGDREHAQHIHGFTPDGDRRNDKATCPPPSAAGDDGLLTLVDGLPFYGPVLVPLDNMLVPLTSERFPWATRDGMIMYASRVATGQLIQAFDNMYEGRQTEADLKLVNRVIVLHGAFVKDGKVVPHWSEGVEYNATLPVACGEIMRKM